MPRPARLTLLMAVALLASASAAGAADRVELEIVTARGTPITAAQEWSRALGELNLASIQIREARPGDKIDIQSQGREGAKTHRVTGMLTSANELQLPGKKFGLADRAQIAQWLTDLQEVGPAAPGESAAPFGLRREQFLALHKRMSEGVAASTSGASPADSARAINQQLAGLCRLDATAARRLAEASPMADELNGMAAGTAMAVVLRSAGLGLAPRRANAGEVACAVIELQNDTPVWPVGRAADDRRRELLPILFDFLNVEIDGVSVAEVVESLAPRLNVPIIYDRLALGRHAIDPGEIAASMPARRTSYSLLLQKALFQARLKYELRVDDAGKPFLWITTIKRV